VAEKVPIFLDYRGEARRRPVRGHEWTIPKREAFLDALASVGSVRHAVASVGMHERSAQALRERDPAFAEAWLQAIKCNYEAIEGDLLRWMRGDREGLDQFDAGAAMALLKQHEAALGGAKRGGGARPRTATKSELIQALKTNIAAVKRQRRRPAP
jgi:hypothetical protein